MLTPSFELTQTEEYLIVNIRAPYAKLSETDIYFEDYDFRFYSKPYYLRLKLPGQVVENGKESAQYDSDKGSFRIEVPKLNPGEMFDGLNLLTKLLAPSHHTIKVPSIEVLGDDDDEKYLDQDEEFTWEIEQVPYGETEGPALSTVKYGFANNYSRMLNRVKEEIADCFDLPDPDDKMPYQRNQEKFEAEMQQFSDDYYLADLYHDEKIQELLKFKAKWEEQTFSDKFTEEEKVKMLKLPNKRFLLDKETKKTLYLGLVDILLAFAYNVRTTEGENTIESSWTICKLSGMLSWFVNFSSIMEVMISFMRRSFCYPLYRHWNLSMKVIEDTQKILSLGQEYVLKCLLEVHSILQESDSRYILNELYVSDYCIWIQSISGKALLSLSDAISKVKINKEHVKLDLIELEAAAVLALKEQSEGLSSSSVENQSLGYSVLNATIDSNFTFNECTSVVPNKDIDVSEIAKKIDEMLLESKVEDSNNKDNKSAIESDCHSSGCIVSTTSESELSDNESSSIISSSLTDSDDYSSSELDTDDESDNEENIDERCHLLPKQRS